MTPRRLRFQKRLKLGFWYSPLLSESRRKTVLPCELTLEEPEAPQERQEDERQHDDDCEPNDVRADSDSDGDEEEQEMEDEDGAVHRPQTRSRTTAYEQLPSEKKQLKNLREGLQRQGDFSKCSIRALQDLILDQRGAPDLKKAMSAGSMLSEADPEATASSRGGSAALSAAAPPSQLHTAKQRRRREQRERKQAAAATCYHMLTTCPVGAQIQASLARTSINLTQRRDNAEVDQKAYEWLMLKEGLRSGVLMTLAVGTLALLPRYVWEGGRVRTACALSLCALTIWSYALAVSLNPAARSRHVTISYRYLWPSTYWTERVLLVRSDPPNSQSSLTVRDRHLSTVLLEYMMDGWPSAFRSTPSMMIVPPTTVSVRPSAEMCSATRVYLHPPPRHPSHYLANWTPPTIRASAVPLNAPHCSHAAPQHNGTRPRI